jgi:hypothetical protein
MAAAGSAARGTGIREAREHGRCRKGRTPREHHLWTARGEASRRPVVWHGHVPHRRTGTREPTAACFAPQNDGRVTLRYLREAHASRDPPMPVHTRWVLVASATKACHETMHEDGCAWRRRLVPSCLTAPNAAQCHPRRAAPCPGSVLLSRADPKSREEHARRGAFTLLYLTDADVTVPAFGSTPSPPATPGSEREPRDLPIAGHAAGGRSLPWCEPRSPARALL